MAGKKPSKYSDRSTIGSAEELDAYGVWVKSEPQDVNAGMADAVNFDTEAVPYADFDMELDDSEGSNFDFADSEESGFDFADLEPVIPEASIENDEGNNNDNFDDGITAAPLGQGGEEASTRLLMKIADELAAIRSELKTLKKEFAGVRIEGVSGVNAAGAATEPRHGGFFDGEEGDDEKITLTGDEMENILTSADFPVEEDIGFDAQREADEAALRELSAQNESAEPQEEIAIDFDNLGINLDDNTEGDNTEGDSIEADNVEAQDDFPPLETGTDLEELSLESIPPLEEMPSEEIQEELMPLKSLEEEDEELQDLRREGAVPFIPAPDNSVYLETDPFALDDSGLEETPEEISEEISIEETPVEETPIEEISEDIPFAESSVAESNVIEDTTPEETVPAETVSQDTASEDTTDLSFDEVSFDLNADDFSIDESLPPLEEETLDTGVSDISSESPAPLEEEQLSEEISIDQTFESPAPPEEEISEEISIDQAPESPAPPEEAISDEQIFDAETLDLSEAVIDEPDLSAGIVEAPLEEPVLGDISFGDDISLDMDDFGSGIDIDIKDSGDTGGDTGSLADNLAIDDSGDGLVESLADENLAIDTDTSVEPDTEEEVIGLADGLSDGIADDLATDDGETSVELDTEDSGDTGGGPAGGLAGGLTDDLTSDLALDDFDANINLDVKENNDSTESLAIDLADDGLAGIIPEGFETNAEEAPISMDDDLEAFADDLSIDEAMPAALPEEASLSETSAAKTVEADADEDIDIPANFKSELKSVLSYMDHLLESLPEDKIEEFAKSEYFDSYRKIFKELGLV